MFQAIVRRLTSAATALVGVLCALVVPLVLGALARRRLPGYDALAAIGPVPGWVPGSAHAGHIPYGSHDERAAVAAASALLVLLVLGLQGRRTPGRSAWFTSAPATFVVLAVTMVALGLALIDGAVAVPQLDPFLGHALDGLDERLTVTAVVCAATATTGVVGYLLVTRASGGRGRHATLVCRTRS